MARLAIALMLAVALLLGGGMWYLQTRAFYFETEVEDVQLTAAETGELTPVRFENAKAIDATSSPIRYRACLVLPGLDPEAFAPYPEAEPLTGPGWFDCYNAEAIGDALEAGEAVAVLGQANVTYGIDRVYALFPDGRAYAWHQINPCGAAVYDGEDAPEGCPPAPEEYEE
ncbi:DUF6446 family protein [Pseudoroseicyclus sp. CXY001]|uniref:DUF6446 family protein n=1 Tax=Pseudoroseicyclus sp. CXY001 TaxID=3242492 RepID=UPI00358DBF3F